MAMARRTSWLGCVVLSVVALGGCPRAVPEQQPPDGQAACRKSGCSGQVCADSEVVSTCEFRPEYECYRQATCERQADGRCGFTPTPALEACLKARSSSAVDAPQ